VFRRRKTVFQIIDTALGVPEPEANHVAADIGSHPDQPGFLMFFIAKIRPFFQITAEGILYGILDILLIA
jgi:hypothetical protein